MNPTENAYHVNQAVKPAEIISMEHDEFRRAALPPGWTLVEKDDEKLMGTPRRKRASVSVSDVNSFTEYFNRHSIDGSSTVWCETDYRLGRVNFTAILNDHPGEMDTPAWRDHLCEFDPEYSEEWARWTAMNKEPFTQTALAAFLEDNLKDIASTEGCPTGAMMLQMAIDFEVHQDMRYKSAIRLQNGGVQLSFTQDDDAQTLQKMQVFERFSLGLPVFWNGDAYRLDARLRYRVREGKLTFWYELIRADKVLEDATKTLIAFIKEHTQAPFFFGNAFVNGK